MYFVDNQNYLLLSMGFDGNIVWEIILLPCGELWMNVIAGLFGLFIHI